jgi:hypothetical protein
MSIAQNAERDAIEFPERDALLDAWNIFFISRASNPRFDATPLPDDDTDFTHQIATLAKARDIDRLRKGICYDVAREWSWHGPKPLHVPWPGWTLLAALKHTRQSALEVYTLLDSADADYEAMLAFLEKTDPAPLLARHAPLREGLARLIEDLSRHISIEEERQEKIIPQRGRPGWRARPATCSTPSTQSGRLARASGPGWLHSTGPGSFERFTLRLLWDTRLAYGSLSLNKNVGEGTLLGALKLLRPHLPPNFIPNTLPMSKLQYIKKLDRKIEVLFRFIRAREADEGLTHRPPVRR